MSLHGPFVLFVDFGSVKICICSPFSGNYVFEPIDLPYFKRVLDSFTNCRTMTLIHAKIFKNPNM